MGTGKSKVSAADEKQKINNNLVSLDRSTSSGNNPLNENDGVVEFSGPASPERIAKMDSSNNAFVKTTSFSSGSPKVKKKYTLRNKQEIKLATPNPSHDGDTMLVEELGVDEEISPHKRAKSSKKHKQTKTSSNNSPHLSYSSSSKMNSIENSAKDASKWDIAVEDMDSM